VRLEEVNPSYSRTRHIPVSPAVLKRNKVFSYFHGHPMADSLKILQTQVLSRLDARGGNTIMLTSANRSEGKTLTAVNLAVSIARELDRTVLLADTNLRHSALMKILGMEALGGLSDYLLKEADIPDLLINPGIQKLVVLPAGRPLPHSAELLGSPRMEALVREMRERYPERLVLFDAPPLLTSADALAFSRFVDGILLVVEAEKTRRDELKRVFELLEGKPVLGTVLNKIRS
jgi:non-specific protein-tyrosine kinase